MSGTHSRQVEAGVSMTMLVARHVKHQNKEPDNQNHLDGTEKAQEFIYFDLERAGGNTESEVIQIGYTDGQLSESIYIQPSGGISKNSSKYSHKMTLSKSGKLISSSGGSTGVSSLNEAAEKFLNFIKRKKEESGKDVCLVFYGGDDEIALLNNLALVRKDQELVENATSFLDFQTVIKDDDQFKDLSISLTKFQPNKKNISQHLLGPKIDKELEKSHDAAVDADLLRRVFEVYIKSCNKAVELKPFTVPTYSSLQIARMVIRIIISCTGGEGKWGGSGSPRESHSERV